MIRRTIYRALGKLIDRAMLEHGKALREERERTAPARLAAATERNLHRDRLAPEWYGRPFRELRRPQMKIIDSYITHHIGVAE